MRLTSVSFSKVVSTCDLAFLNIKFWSDNVKTYKKNLKNKNVSDTTVFNKVLFLINIYGSSHHYVNILVIDIVGHAPYKLPSQYIKVLL